MTSRVTPTAATPATEFFRRIGGRPALAELFEVLPNVYLFVKDRQHRFVMANRSELQLHNLKTEAEIVGRTDFDFHPPALAAQYVEEDRKVMAAGRP